MERRRNETKGKAPIIGVRVLCRESYVFLTGEMSTGTIGNCYGAPTRPIESSWVQALKTNFDIQIWQYLLDCINNYYFLRYKKIN